MKKVLIPLLFIIGSSIGILKAQLYTIKTFAGDGIVGPTLTGATAINAKLHYPCSVAVDNLGNVYIANYDNNRISEVDTNNVIVPYAGKGIYGYSGDGSAASLSELSRPTGIVIDDSGNGYIADYDNNCIRKVNTHGIISTFAGNGIAGDSGDGGLATAAKLRYPLGVAIDHFGDLYIAEGLGNCIREVNSHGIISTFAGKDTAGFFGDGGQATSAKLFNPYGVAVDDTGNVYIADNGNNRIRKVNTHGIITTIVGNGTPGFFGDGLAATGAELNQPQGVSIDVSGNLYITDYNNQRIRKVNTSGIISTIAGNGSEGFFGDGGPATSAKLYNPAGVVAIDRLGNVYIADQSNQRIRKLTVVGAGINELNVETENVSVYPNPNNGVFAVFCHSEGSEESPSIIKIYNLLGEQMLTETLLRQPADQGDNTIDLSGKPNGVYLYRVITQDGKLIGTGKFIIER